MSVNKQITKGDTNLKNKKLIIFVIIILIIIVFLGIFKNKILKIIYPKTYSEFVTIYAEKYNVEENLIYAVIKAESNFEKDAVSHRNALGLMQIMEDTAIDVAKKYNIPLVITEHSSVERGVYVRKSYYKRIIDSYKTADKIITVGNGLKKEIEKLAGRNDIQVIGNLVDLSLFYIRNVKKENNDFTFFSVAFLEGEKGFDTLIKSFAKVYKNKNVKLVIGGDGSQKEWLKGIAKENGVEPQVLFTGALSREEVASWMNKCDIFVLPSRYETFGVVYIEALASGKPVIATFNGGAEDIINEEVGVLVEIDNVNKLAQAMEKVRENYNKYNPESLRNYCTEKFSANVIIKKIINVYKKVIR